MAWTEKSHDVDGLITNDLNKHMIFKAPPTQPLPSHLRARVLAMGGKSGSGELTTPPDFSTAVERGSQETTPLIP